MTQQLIDREAVLREMALAESLLDLPPHSLTDVIAALPVETAQATSAEREEMARQFNEWANDAIDHGTPMVPVSPAQLFKAVRLLRAPQQATSAEREELAQQVDEIADTKRFSYRDHQRLKRAARLLRAQPDDEAVRILAELVSLKTLKDQDWMSYDEKIDYAKRKPQAWEAARAYLASKEQKG